MAEARADRADKDLTLAPNEFAWVMDETTGIIKAYTGPLSSSLTLSERTVLFDATSKRFTPVSAERGKQLKLIAPEGWYIILKNPALDRRHPSEKDKSNMPELQTGTKVNIAGPVMFALWPGQMASVVKGHHLRQDEYLIARVYDSTAAQNSYDDTVVVTKDTSESLISKDRLTQLAGLSDAQPDAVEEQDTTPDLPPERPGTRRSKLIAREELTTGKLFIIKGTEVSFYMPPSGIEIVKANGSYIQNAVSLERLEYCLLLDQSGNKRYVRGPAVVFPEPTEDFVTDGNLDEDGEPIRKFRSIELGPTQGIYVKVIADYTEDVADPTGQRIHHKVGEELFITGKESPIYFPREEHLVIKYGDKHTVHCGVAIPAGEARYVLKRLEGHVVTQKGPTVLLPDPRTDLIVRRRLSDRMCKLLYPGNAQALEVNQRITARSPGGTLNVNLARELDSNLGFIASTSEMSYSTNSSTASPLQARQRRAGHTVQGDVVDRDGQFVPPRSITLDSKYEGAVTVSVWEGYALMLINKQGGRRVVQGPETALLDYDEDPHVLTLSTGKPKTTDALFETVYLRTTNNYVTDILTADTADYVNVKIKLIYRLNFEGDDPHKWFSVENYVKLLCDHMRSIIRNHVRQLTVAEFYRKSTEILHDLILGEEQESGTRPGLSFKENGMRVIDVEVIGVSLSDEIQRMLESQELTTIKRSVELDTMKRHLEFTREAERIKVEEASLKESTAASLQEHLRARLADDATTTMARHKFSQEAEQAVHAQHLARERTTSVIEEIIRERKLSNETMVLSVKEKEQQLQIALLEADAATTSEKMKSITPRLIEAIQSIGDRKTIVEIAEAMSAQGLLRTMRGEPLVEVIGNVLKGTEIGRRFTASNGAASLPAE